MSDFEFSTPAGDAVRAKYRREGSKAERERIIKLLESIYDYPKDWDYDNPIESVIALIKGENK